ncbi:hypothetical protein UFOVP643_14 [uncultured Caudovirales phage]|uniref:Uncharacterized protein n=1 Tax=uncultured Caudovirales phage TaxID=2100421 RepID=A0A6J5NBR1_9CAUD|nr:hypothetical protein UFOVP282_21 [uncultured Caudovirales phage]CAB4154595.1 hypothetical protein UFOVP643_14 [uncultured Caudovirales phage]
MGFKIINNQKVDENRIEWKFESMDRVFVSNADKFKRNIEFWKAKFNVGHEVQVEILNGVEHVYAQIEADKNTQDVEHEEVHDDSLLEQMSEDFNELLENLENDELTIDQSSIEPDCDEPNAQPSVLEVTENTISTPKRKPRTKTTKL